MSTNDSNNVQTTISANNQLNSVGSGINELMDVLKTVKVDTPESKLNATSITDYKNRRIELDDDKIGSKVF